MARDNGHVPYGCDGDCGWRQSIAEMDKRKRDASNIATPDAPAQVPAVGRTTEEQEG